MKSGDNNNVAVPIRKSKSHYGCHSCKLGKLDPESEDKWFIL